MPSFGRRLITTSAKIVRSTRIAVDRLSVDLLLTLQR
jgi:hypothetical protein